MGSCSFESSRKCSAWHCNARGLEINLDLFLLSLTVTLDIFFIINCFFINRFPCPFSSKVKFLYITRLDTFSASLVGNNSPLQIRENMYLLAVGYYRSGDYSRSRQLVGRCLEVRYVFTPKNLLLQLYTDTSNSAEYGRIKNKKYLHQTHSVFCFISTIMGLCISLACQVALGHSLK